MYQIILLIHSFIAVALIGMVLIQHGKGAQIGASFGSGASTTVFGSQGSGSFLLKVTAMLAAGFFATSLTLSYLAAMAANASQSHIAPVSQRAAQPPVPVPDVKPVK